MEIENYDKIKVVEVGLPQLLSSTPSEYPKVLLDLYYVDGELFPVVIRVFNAPDIAHRAAINMLSENVIEKLCQLESFPYKNLAEQAIKTKRKFVNVLAERMSNYYVMYDFDTLINLLKFNGKVDVYLYSKLFRRMIIDYLGPLVKVQCFCLLSKEDYFVGFDYAKPVSNEPDSVRYNNFKQQVESLKIKFGIIAVKFPDFMQSDYWKNFIKELK